VLYLNVTTHVEGDKDQDLLGQKGGGGFPYLIVMDADGKVMAKHQGARTTEGFEATLKTATEFADARKKAAEGTDAGAKLEVFTKDLEFGNYGAADARKAYEALGTVGDAEKTKIEGLLAVLEIREVMAAINKKAEKVGDAPDKDAQFKLLRIEAGKKFMEMNKAGRVPGAGTNETSMFWSFILEAAEDAKDVAAFEAGLAKLKDLYASNPQAQKFIQDKEAILQKMKEQK